MKTITHTRRLIAAAAILFAATLSGCEKAELLPVNNNINLPVAADTGRTVSVKRTANSQQESLISDVSLGTRFRYIVTSNSNGVVIRTQTYNYYGTSFSSYLNSYMSPLGEQYDTVARSNSNQMNILRTNLQPQCISISSTDRRMLSMTIGTTGASVAFTQNQYLLKQATQYFRGVQGTQTNFTYTGKNVTTIENPFSKATISYYTDLPYQKGINMIPWDMDPIRYFKLMELSGFCSTILYENLIKKVVVMNSSGTFTYDYKYSFNSNKEVTQITEIITQKTASAQTTSTFTHKITYV